MAATFLGVFDEEPLIGIGVLESRRVGRFGDQMQLAYLYVGRTRRGHGVGCGSSQPPCLARKRPHALYVSATPTENTVDFYLNRGCVLAPEPDPRLLAAEPEDIHLLYHL